MFLLPGGISFDCKNEQVLHIYKNELVLKYYVSDSKNKTHAIFLSLKMNKLVFIVRENNYSGRT